MFDDTCYEHKASDNYLCIYTYRLLIIDQYDEDTIHILLKLKPEIIKSVILIYNDPYVFDTKVSKWVKINSPMILTNRSEEYEYWRVAIKPKHRRLSYGFKLIDTENRSIYIVENGYYIDTSIASFPMENYFHYPFLHKEEAFHYPKWLNSTIWYQIFPERFDNGNPSISPENVLKWDSSKPKGNSFFGGDIQGIINHIDYLKDLGITGIYSTPMFESPSNHKYDTIDYLTIDRHFGDENIFMELIDKLHDNNIRYLMDTVFNHCSERFPYFQDVFKNGEKSKYKDWFYCNEFPLSTNPLNYETFGFYGPMPKLNMFNPETKEYFLSIANTYINKYKVDGLRLDVANEVPHSFWKSLRELVKSKETHIPFILGEIWQYSMPWLHGDEFDSIMNYPLRNIILQYFANNSITTDTFVCRLIDILNIYPAEITEHMFNLLGSHDTARILTECGESIPKVKLCFTFLLTYLGQPCIYYGDEIGMSGGGDPDCRGCMKWNKEDQNEEILLHVKRLIEIRKKYNELTESGVLDMNIQFLSDCSFGFSRYYNGYMTIVIFNTSEKEEFYVQSDSLKLFSRNNDFEDDGMELYRSEEIKLPIKLETQSFCILRYKINISFPLYEC